jgi:ADP-heptose:LPS heptosyltransferase
VPGALVVVRGGALGDNLLGVPALRALRRRFPGQPLHLVAPQPQAGLLRHLGVVDGALAVDDPSLTSLFLEGRPLERLPAQLRQAGLAVVWLHGGDVIAANLARAGAGQVLSARALPDEGGAVHAADWLLQTLAPLGIQAPPDWDREPWLSVPPETQEWAARWHREEVGEGPYFVLHPGSGSARKNWPGAEWAAAVREYQHLTRLALVVVAGPADDGPLESLLAALPRQSWSPARPDVVFRPPDLTQLAGVLHRAASFLGHDSGVTHLAAGLGRPTVAVFGPTDPALWRPRGPRVRVLGGRGAWPTAPDVVAAVRDLLHP